MAGEESKKATEAGRSKVGFMSDVSCGAMKDKEKEKKNLGEEKKKNDNNKKTKKKKTKKKKEKKKQKKKEASELTTTMQFGWFSQPRAAVGVAGISWERVGGQGQRWSCGGHASGPSDC